MSFIFNRGRSPTIRGRLVEASSRFRALISSLILRWLAATENHAICIANAWMVVEPDEIREMSTWCRNSEIWTTTSWDIGRSDIETTWPYDFVDRCVTWLGRLTKTIALQREPPPDEWYGYGYGVVKVRNGEEEPQDHSLKICVWCRVWQMVGLAKRTSKTTIWRPLYGVWYSECVVWRRGPSRQQPEDWSMVYGMVNVWFGEEDVGWCNLWYGEWYGMIYVMVGEEDVLHHESHMSGSRW